MFTGLIQHCGTITAVTHSATDAQLTIQTQFEQLTIGESIAVDGTCLTIIDCNAQTFQVALSAETLQITIAKHYQPGQIVNLERALTLHDRLGGHFVTGHIDQTAIIQQILPQDKFFCYTISGIAHQHQCYLIPKGSITVNGTSLTINKVLPAAIEIMLIPHTLAHTNLSQLKINDTVNIEFDLLTKIVAQQTKGIIHEYKI